MAMSSPIRTIPGAFGSDLGQSDHNILAPKLDINVGARSHVFQPPRTPSASSSLAQSCALSDYQTPCLSRGTSRKRTRLDDSSNQHWVSRKGRQGWSVEPKPREAPLATTTEASPAPLANTRYRLAGGIDRPSGATNLLAYGIESSGAVSSTTEKPVAGTKRCFDDDDYDDYGFQSFTPTSRTSRRGGALQNDGSSSSDHSGEGWARLVLDVFGNVAGRVWEFCRAGAFRGFYAGGGQGYQMDGAQETAHYRGLPVQDEKDDQDNIRSDFVQASTAPASPMAQDELTGSYVRLDHSPKRASKRIQREKGESESRDRWIMVSSGTTPSSLDKRTRASEAGIPERANVRKGRTPLERAVASRAGRRSALATTPTRPVRPPASYASPRASPSPSTDAALVSPETRRLMARHRRQERATDASIQQFNRRLKAMIQQGKEALGTTYTIEDEGPDADMYDTDADGASDDAMDL